MWLLLKATYRLCTTQRWHINTTIRAKIQPPPPPSQTYDQAVHFLGLHPSRWRNSLFPIYAKVVTWAIGILAPLGSLNPQNRNSLQSLPSVSTPSIKLPTSSYELSWANRSVFMGDLLLNIGYNSYQTLMNKSTQACSFQDCNCMAFLALVTKMASFLFRSIQAYKTCFVSVEWEQALQSITLVCKSSKQWWVLEKSQFLHLSERDISNLIGMDDQCVIKVFTQ